MGAVLVTGGTGFIGRRLVRSLIAAGAEVLLLQRRAGDTPAGANVLLAPEFTPERIANAVTGRRLSTVYHLAAYGVAPQDRDPALTIQINLGATLALVEEAARCGASAMVVAGSVFEYAAPEGSGLLAENSPLETTKIYGATKAAAGIAANALALARGLPLAHARLFHVYGPGEAPHRLLPSLLRGFRAGQRIALSPGLQTRDFLYVDDAVEAMQAIAKGLLCDGVEASGIFNVATGSATTVRDFAEAAARAASFNPELLGFGEIPTRPGDAEWLVGSPRRMLERFSWQPRFGVDAGVAAAWQATHEP